MIFCCRWSSGREISVEVLHPLAHWYSVSICLDSFVISMPCFFFQIYTKWPFERVHSLRKPNNIADVLTDLWYVSWCVIVGLTVDSNGHTVLALRFKLLFLLGNRFRDNYRGGWRGQSWSEITETVQELFMYRILIFLLFPDCFFAAS